MRVSIAMAVFNGEKYVREQIDSILPQLTEDDELVISYNPSLDSTLSIIESYAQKDNKVKVCLCEEEGVKPNFTNAVRHCTGEYIFFADQDDVWSEHKIERVMDTLRRTGATMVVHNARYTDADLNPLPSTIFENRNTKTGVVRNIIKGGYYGCCMAFSCDLVPYIFPIPEDIPSHDMWTGLMAGIRGEIALLDEELVLYRRHGSNISPETHGTLPLMIRYRYILIKNLLKRYFEIEFNKRNKVESKKSFHP